MSPGYRIYVYYELGIGETNHWHDCQEGPFDTAKEAIIFARDEIGAAWIVLDEYGKPIAFGDAAQHFGQMADAIDTPSYSSEYRDTYLRYHP